MAPKRLTRPYVALMPVMPQNALGPRIDPPVSEPSAAKARRAATAAETAANLARQAMTGARWLTFESEPSNYAERLAASAPRS